MIKQDEIFWANQNFPSQETEEIQHPTRPVENVALTTKGLQKR